jgi:hypothetical protein
MVVPLAAGAAADRGFADWLAEELSTRPDRRVRGRLALDQFGRLGTFALLKGAAGFGIRLVRGAMSAPSAQS